MIYIKRKKEKMFLKALMFSFIFILSFIINGCGNYTIDLLEDNINEYKNVETELDLITTRRAKQKRLEWEEMPGRAIDIGVGGRGEVYVCGLIDTKWGGRVYKWSGTKWLKIRGYLTRITVDSYGNPWGINKEGKIFKGDGYGGWTELPGRAIDIAAGGYRGNHRIFKIGQENNDYGGCVYKWLGTKWQKISGYLTRIAVDSNGNPWGINKEGKIFKGDGYGGWTELPSKATCDIGGGKDIFMLGHSYLDPWGGEVWRWTGIGPHYWECYFPSSGYGNNIDAGWFGGPWMTNNEGKIFRLISR